METTENKVVDTTVENTTAQKSRNTPKKKTNASSTAKTTEKKSTSTATKSKSFEVKVIAKKGLNIRESTSIESDKIEVLKYNTVITVDKKDGEWYHIPSKGWICAKYVKEI